MAAKSEFLIGSYTRDTAASGIYYVATDGTSQCVIEAENPSYLLAHPSAGVIYCVNEIADYRDPNQPGSKSGSVGAYQIRYLSDGSFCFEFLNQQSSMGADPCHLSINQDATYLIVSNYTGGTFATLPLIDDGSVEPFQSLTQHNGSGPHAARQSSAHVHSSLLLDDDKTLFIADLGADRVSQYSASQYGDIELARQHIVCRPGSGPRFLTASDTHLYVLNELDNTLSCYQLSDGSLCETISVVPDQFADSVDLANNLPAHLLISADQRFLYLSNRGLDTISVYTIEPELALVQTISSGGKHPRHFTLCAAESILAVANMHSDNLVLFARNQASGELTPTSTVLQVPSPACVLPMTFNGNSTNR